jgi:hypothetical protein
MENHDAGELLFLSVNPDLSHTFIAIAIGTGRTSEDGRR